MTLRKPNQRRDPIAIRYRRTIPRRFRAIFLLTALSVSVLLPESTAQVRPEEPIRGFRLPFFDEEGRRQWEARGEQAVYQEDETVLLEKAKIKVFPRRAEEQPTIIRSPHARVDVPGEKVSGDQGLTLQTAIGRGSARHWSFAQKDRVLRLEGEVRLELWGPLPDDSRREIRGLP